MPMWILILSELFLTGFNSSAFQVTVCAREGLNRLNISTYDARSFCLGVRIIRRLSLEQVCAASIFYVNTNAQTEYMI